MIDPAQLDLIDREVEVGALDRALARAVDSQTGHFRSVVGLRGVGKSRVVNTFQKHCQAGDVTLLMAECVGHDAESLLPVRDALRPYLGTTQQAIRRMLKRMAPDLLELVPVIGRFLSQVGRDLAESGPMGGDNPRSLYDLLATLILKLGSPAVCLILEDLHRADADTLHFLNYLFNKSRHSPSLIIVTLPTEESSDEAMGEFLSEMDNKGALAGTVEVQPLGPEHVHKFVGALFGSQACPAESTVQFVAAFTGGNPFFLAETLRDLDSDGMVRLEDGTVHVTPPREVPHTLEHLLERRLGRLEPSVRTFVDVAAVVADTSQNAGPVLDLLGVDEAMGLDALAASCRAGILVEKDDGRIVFTSEMLRLATYANLGVNRRQRLHLRAAEWFEAHDAFSEAAHHFERAGDQKRMVSAALKAADVAELVGTYQKALDWYRKAQPLADPRQVSPRLVKALLAVGNWTEAERVLDTLPADEPHTLLLRADLLFLRGNVSAAAEIAFDALSASEAQDLSALLRLADLNLYLGRFSTAGEFGERALETARTSGSLNDQARCLVVIGATKMYRGNIQQAKRCFDDGLEIIDQQPTDSQNKDLYSALLGNRGSLDEVEQNWESAEAFHQAALTARLDVANARGVVETELALGRVQVGRGDLVGAEARLSESRQRAEDLGEDLQLAKILHAQGQLSAARNDVETAIGLVDDARSRFLRCGTPYDVAYAELDLARLHMAGNERGGLMHRASGRAAVERGGFTLLFTLFPELNPPLRDRIHSAFLAYAAGDALGLPWEGRPPSGAATEAIEALPVPEHRPAGSPSDDTALTILVGEHVTASRGMGDPQVFLRRLVEVAPSIPDLGPSTRAAVQQFGATHRAWPGESNTNGAAMRALPIGWALPVDHDEDRRSWVLGLSSVTHTGPEALIAACVVAACGSWALEDASASLLVEIAIEEAATVASRLGAGHRVHESLTAVRDGTWTAPPSGISLDPAETVAAVLACVRRTSSLRDTLISAVSLGGDTDTVAGLVGGIVGSRAEPDAIRTELPWFDRVRPPAETNMAELALRLAELRFSANV